MLSFFGQKFMFFAFLDESFNFRCCCLVQPFCWFILWLLQDLCLLIIAWLHIDVVVNNLTTTKKVNYVILFYFKWPSLHVWNSHVDSLKQPPSLPKIISTYFHSIILSKLIITFILVCIQQNKKFTYLNIIIAREKVISWRLEFWQFNV